MMDDSKLRLRSRRTCHAITTSEEGTAGGLHHSEGNANISNSSSNNQHQQHQQHQHQLPHKAHRSSDNLSLLVGMGGASSSASGSRIQRQRQHRRKRRRILWKACRLLLGGLAAAIVTATLSVGLLPFSWTQVDYHHQLQQEVQYVYQKLHDNRQNYHSVVDNYHPNGMSSEHNHHHHIHGHNDGKSRKKPRHGNRKHGDSRDRLVKHGHDNDDHNDNDNDNDDAFQGPPNPGDDAYGDEARMGPKRNPRKRHLRRAVSSLTRRDSKGKDDEDRDPSAGGEGEQEREQEREPAHLPSAPAKKPEIVRCGDGTVGFRNDDYCDCLEDGRDEPDTSACSHVLAQQKKFVCGRRGTESRAPTRSIHVENGNHQNQQNGNGNHQNEDEDGLVWIYASRVNDGILDCPDGSDEYGHVLEAVRVAEAAVSSSSSAD